MFVEPQSINLRSGWLEVICGSMFSGKTEELMRRIKRAQIAELPTILIKPAEDTRYAEEEIVSHDEKRLPSYAVHKSSEILPLAEDSKVIGIDEGQFFDNGLVEVSNELVAQGKRVIVAGLDMDYKGHPFEPIPSLMATADFVTKVHAICVRCGAIAHHSYRLASSQEKILLGSDNEYEPRCRVCFQMGNILDLRAK